MQMMLMGKNANKMPAICKMVCFALALCFAIILLIPIGARAATPVWENGLTEDNYAAANFSSHMPILVLEVPADVEPLDANGYFLPTDVSIFEGEEKNSFTGTPSVPFSGSMRNMTDKENGANTEYKSDYYLRLSQKESVMSLGTTSEYLLLGGMKDKSLLRNYLGYTLNDRIMRSETSSQLCEVFFNTKEGKIYQGVYLVVALSLPENSTLFHRSTKEDGIVIDTYATQNGFSDDYLSIPFMEATTWDEKYSELIGEFSIAESVLYSEESVTFYNYIDRYDVESFIESFLLGEITQNYAETHNAYYYYDPATKKIAAAPIYNFEAAFDNERRTYADPSQIQYQKAPYYAELFKSPQFATQVQAFYVKARNVGLSETDITQLIDEAAAYVAPVVGRDWARWDSYSNYVLQPVSELVADDEIVTQLSTPFRRATATYDQEIVRMRYGLRAHNLHTSLALTQFDFSEQEISREIVLNNNPIWVVVFIIVLFAAIHFARRYGE